MSICMAGVDHEHAEIGLREQVSFVAGQVGAILQGICNTAGVLGAVLISTCNRTELYLSLIHI